MRQSSASPFVYRSAAHSLYEIGEEKRTEGTAPPPLICCSTTSGRRASLRSAANLGYRSELINPILPSRFSKEKRFYSCSESPDVVSQSAGLMSIRARCCIEGVRPLLNCANFLNLATLAIVVYSRGVPRCRYFGAKTKPHKRNSPDAVSPEFVNPLSRRGEALSSPALSSPDVVVPRVRFLVLSSVLTKLHAKGGGVRTGSTKRYTHFLPFSFLLREPDSRKTEATKTETQKTQLRNDRNSALSNSRGVHRSHALENLPGFKRCITSICYKT